MSQAAFTPGQVTLATLLSLGVEAGLFGLILMTQGRLPAPPPEPLPLSVLVNPVDNLDAPLLKRGSRPVAKEPDPPPKLPDKVPDKAETDPPPPAPPPPAPPPKAEAENVPSTKAENKPEAVVKKEPPKPEEPSPKPTKPDKPPKPSQATAPQAEPAPPRRKLQMPKPDEEEEGDERGVDEGTEPDPLKARAVSQYRARLIAWFNKGFNVPSGSIDCATLKTLRTRVSAQIGADGTVLGYRIVAGSGNDTFDGFVEARMQASVGQQVPPPPPNYPDLLDSDVMPTFSGEKQCE